MNTNKIFLSLIALSILCMLATGCKPKTPTAAFSADKREGTAPLKVFFQDESTLKKSLDMDAESLKQTVFLVNTPKAQFVEAWSWDFGDGESSKAQHTYHTYKEPGEYTVSLVVRTNKGKTDYLTRKNYITVEGDGSEGEASEGESAEGEGEPVEGEGEGEGEGESVEGEGEDGEGEIEPIDEVIVTLPGNVPLVLLHIPAGTFMMGRYPGERESGGDEDPQHEVILARDIWIGKYEITQAQWLAIMGDWPGTPPSEAYGLGDTIPAYNVSWDNIQSFLMALNEHVNETGQGPAALRLPSEAEWEYAARAGTTTRFYWGDDPTFEQIDAYAWYIDNSGAAAHPVGEKLANAFGLYDMAGNLWEWCEDDYHDSYAEAPADGSAWVDEPRGAYRVLRGGSKANENWACRSGNRLDGLPSARYVSSGFRVVDDVTE